MTLPSLLEEPGRVDEPQAAREYADVLSQVAAVGRPVIVRRNGKDLAAVIPLEHLELVREALCSPGSRESGSRDRLDRERRNPYVHRNRGSTTTTTPLSPQRKRHRELDPPAPVRQRRMGEIGSSLPTRASR